MNNALIIDQFFEANVNNDVRSFGYQLCSDDAVYSLKYSKDGKTVFAYVITGGRQFLVTVENYNNTGLRVICTCSRVHGGVCVHAVAVLYKLREGQMEIATPPQIKHMIQIARNSAEPLFLAGFETQSEEFLMVLEDISRRLTFYDLEIGKTNLHPQGITFTINEQFGKQYKYVVKLFLEKEKYCCFCSCSQPVTFACRHEVFVLKKFLRSGKKNFNLIKPGYVEQIFRELSEEYSVPSNMLNESTVSVSLDNRFLPSVKLIGKLEGLIHPETVQQGRALYLDFLQSVKKDPGSLQRIFTSPTENLLPGFVFTFLSGSGVFFLETLVPVTGKANKENTRIVSKVEGLTKRDLLTLSLTENEREAIRLSRELPDFSIPVEHAKAMKFNYETPEYFHKHRQIGTIFALLKNRFNIFVLASEPDGIKKPNLVDINVSDVPLEISARLVSDKDFISLTPKISLGEKILEFSDSRLIPKSPMIWEYNKCLHLVSDVTQIAPFLYFRSWPVLKSSMARMPEFIEKVVLPFSSRFNIEVEGLENIELNEVFLTPVKKQVYLSESQGFLLFAPVVAYNHKKEVLVLSGASLVEYTDGQFTIFRRDLDYENDFLEFLRSLHPEFAGQTQEEALALPLNEIVDKHWFFDAFEAMKSKNVEVMGLQLLKSFKYSPYRATIRTGISSGVDWFDLSVNVSFGEYEVPLKKLRRHILENEKYIELGDGSVGILPSEWIEKLKKYFRIGELQGDKLLLSKLRFGLVDELFDNIDETAIAQELAEKKARIQSFETITNIKKPAAIKAQLRDYQKAGLNWLGFLDEMKWGGILADDMGLGKTVQILTFLATQKSVRPKTSLVVLPTTLIFNWENEINKFYPTLKVLFYYGSNRDKEVLKSNDYQLVVTTYGVMMNDIEILKEIKFNYVILDESQAIKNPLSKRYKAACLLQGKNRLTLTGTPIENNTFDLYAQMNFVNPGMLGNQKFFKEQYSNPVDKDQDAGRANELRKLVSPFILRRTKEQVATELPPKTEDVIWCRMERDQFRIYEEYRERYRSYLLNKIDENGLEKSKMFVLEGLLKLRQICNSPELLKDEDEKLLDSVKLDELMRQINEKTGNHKIVVFSQFVQMLKIIERELKREGHDYEYFDGSTVQKQRRDSVNRFQEDTKCRVFLISLKAGGTGINLTSADYVYIFDPWWNPAVENQAIDRTYRIGQDKKVFAYRMICKDTIEEKILKYQDRKKAVAADIIRTEESFIKHLTKEDIGELFG